MKRLHACVLALVIAGLVPLASVVNGKQELIATLPPASAK